MSITSFKNLLDVYFAAGMLPEAERAKYYLICRYQDKVSQRLLDEQAALYAKGKQLSEMFRKELMRPRSETRFGMLPKNDDWVGGYVTVPFRFPT